MLPGEWYSRDDVRRAAGYGHTHGPRVTWTRMLTAGLIERAEDPNWKPFQTARDRALAIARGSVPPTRGWLYRMTPTGEALKAAVRPLGMKRSGSVSSWAGLARCGSRHQTERRNERLPCATIGPAGVSYVDASANRRRSFLDHGRATARRFDPSVMIQPKRRPCRYRHALRCAAQTIRRYGENCGHAAT
jgi:hypothetical protein